MRQFLKFCAAGAFHTVIGYIVIFGLMALSVGPTLSNVAGYAVGLAIAFVTHRFWVFEKGTDPNREAARYLGVFLVSFFVNILALRLLLLTNISPYLAQVLAGAAYIVASFSLNRIYVFRHKCGVKV